MKLRIIIAICVLVLLIGCNKEPECYVGKIHKNNSVTWSECIKSCWINNNTGDIECLWSNKNKCVPYENTSTN